MRGFGIGILFGIFVSWSMACTSLMPMTHDLSGLTDERAMDVAIKTGLTVAQVKDPTIHEVHEVRLSFTQMLDECYPSVKWYLRLLGSVPLGCTKIIQQPWNEKVAIIYFGWYTDPFTMAHEREHAKGKMHAYW